MQHHIGTRVISSTPMTRAKYNEYRGWQLPAKEDGTDAGYLVEYQDGGKPNDDRHTGYISWSPKAQHDAAYRPCNAMTFGLAIEALKKGLRVARAGWNGKGMWLEMQRPGEHSKMTLPYLYLNYPNDSVNTPGARVPWLASQTDMLAEDWTLVA